MWARLRRVLLATFAVVGVLVLCCLLYLAFGDLSRHKHRLERFVVKHTGREFVIEGDFDVEVFPAITVLAEKVRFANADWGSKPQMVQVGHLSAEVGLWSLFSGPVDVRSFELTDVVVLLEQKRGKANWIFKEPGASDDTQDAEPDTRTRFPVVIEKATVEDLRLTYRTAGKPDLVARLDSLTITPGEDGLLGLEGTGKLDEFPITLKGQAGPIDSLLSGRDIRMDLSGRVGRLAVDIHGGLGDLDPLDGADLEIKAHGEDVGAMLTRLNLPVIATGTLDVNARLEDDGKRTSLKLDADIGDLTLKAHGSLGGLYLRDSDVNFEANAADAARLASVFGVNTLPAAPLTFSGRVMPTRKEIKVEALKAQYAGLTTQADGTLKRGRRREIALRFDLAVENLAAWRDSLPESAASAKGSFKLNDDQLEVSELTAALGENVLNGSFSMKRTEPRRMDAELSSPRLDLTPYFAKPAEDAAATPSATPAKPKPKPANERLFTDTPLPFRKWTGAEARLHLAVTELTLANKVFKDVDGTVVLDGNHVELRAGAHGSYEGALNAAINIEPTSPDNANVNLKVDIENVRAGLDMKEMQPEEIPPLSVTVDLTTHGGTPRQLAANANGHILLTQGAGKTRAAFLNAFGGDTISQLRTKLNPFRSQDPFTQLDCTVIRADVTNGMVTVSPVLVQTRKVTVAAKGSVDLRKEQIVFDFDTRPRKGIGVSPGMFTNPFIRLEGTLMNPRMAMGAKGVGSGAVAAATGGLSVIAGGFIDRLKGEANMCSRTLEKATVARAPK